MSLHVSSAVERCVKNEKFGWTFASSAFLKCLWPILDPSLLFWARSRKWRVLGQEWIVTDLAPTTVTQGQVSGFILNPDWSIWTKSLVVNRTLHCHHFVSELDFRRDAQRVCPQAPQAQNTWCMRQLLYIENCMGKSPIVKKNLCK